MKYILTLDQGTTSSRAIVFDINGKIVSKSQKEFTQIYPHPSWVEHNPIEIWETQLKTAHESIKNAQIDAGDIISIAITNQRETTIVWDAETGVPIYNAIVWQCRRTSDICDKLKEDKRALSIHSKTGLNLDPYFSASKIKWILDNVDGAKEKARNGNLLFGTVDTWLLWNLTGGKIHATDYTNASRTLLFNINTLKWDSELLSLFDIPDSMLPIVYPSGYEFGKTDDKFFGREIPIRSIIGDQQSSLFGQMCFEKGEAKNTYGTGCFVLMNIGDKPSFRDKNVISTVAWGINNDIKYACEGSVFMAGAVIQWLRDGLKIIKSPEETDEIARNVKNNDGVYIVPSFTGLGAPYWNPYARGTIVGLTRGSTHEHIVRSALECIAYQSADVIKEIEMASGVTLDTLGCDGGASKNSFLMQFQSDITNKQLIIPQCLESTALGTTLLAGLVSGVYKDYTDIRRIKVTSKIYIPQIGELERIRLLNGWHKAVKTAISYTKN